MDFGMFPCGRFRFFFYVPRVCCIAAIKDTGRWRWPTVAKMRGVPIQAWCMLLPACVLRVGCPYVRATFQRAGRKETTIETIGAPPQPVRVIREIDGYFPFLQGLDGKGIVCGVCVCEN